MSGNSEYFSKLIANWVRGSAMPTAPTTLYLGLSTAVVSGVVAPSEPSGGGYARKAITFSAPAFTDVDGSQISSLADIVFATATANWGVMTDGFVSDALTGGNVLEKWTWPVSKTINTSDTYVVATGDVTISF